MTEILASKYRPASFEDMVGQGATSLVLSKMVEKDDIPTGFLFSGPRGSGKTSAARILANTAEDSFPIEVDAASHGSVQDVREMIETLRYSSGGKHRFIIYDEAHSMSKEAFNALLKALEEPPAGTHFILVTTEPERIPGTVKSRMMSFVFKKISPADILDRLCRVAEVELIEAEHELLTFIAVRADGSMRDALMTLDQCHRAEIRTCAEFLELAGEVDVAPSLVTALVHGNHAEIFELADEVSQSVPDPSRMVSAIIGVLRDILVLKSGGELDMPAESILSRKELSHALETDRILAGLTILWDLKTKARQSSDPRSNLDLALVLLSEIFTRGKKIAAKQPNRVPLDSL